jgi:hypothetical protein
VIKSGILLLPGTVNVFLLTPVAAATMVSPIDPMLFGVPKRFKALVTAL